MNLRHHHAVSLGRRTALALAIGLGTVSGAALAQSNVTGSIFGSVNQQGTSVTVSSADTGFSRTINVDANGRYRFSALPPGNYKVSLENNGAVVSTRDNVTVTISGGSDVSFGSSASATEAATLEGVSVSASAMPSIDVSSVDTRTVLTAEQLNKLPITRDVLAAALLAPGVIGNSSYKDALGNPVPSFGGSASSENAYFINGYAVTNPLTSIGLTQLPFDAIDQQQVLTGGYGAEFGRSTGGVINIVTKRGTNEWHAGVYTIWEPSGTRASPRNSNYPDTGFYPTTDGTVYQYFKKNEYWRSTVGAYASGPLIKDKLFFYVDAEMNRREGAGVQSSTTAGAVTSATVGRNGWNDYQYKIPRWLAKLDWNITDDHHIELTGVSDKTEYTSATYGFNYASKTHGAVQNGGSYTKDGGDLYVGKYTGYITDNFTVSALYGQQRVDHVQTPFGYNANCPLISIASAASRAPGISYGSCQTTATSVRVPGANDATDGWRLDLEYRLGDHDIKFGADRQQAKSFTGTSLPGGYSWTYNQQNNAAQAIDAGHGVGSPASAGGLGTQGYYVTRAYTTTSATVKTVQESQYLEDHWQVTDRWLVYAGLRNEQFKNFNGNNQVYAKQRHQLAPRLGVSWDVMGDSTLKVYANAGRYHLAMPNNVAVRAASGSLGTSEYFTYTGTDPVTGAPTGLTPVPVNQAAGYTCGGTNAVSANLECGVAPDPRTVAAKGLKSHYQDEYIAGLDQAITPTLNWGAKLTWRQLRSAIDDTCTPALGGACFLFNPGTGNTFLQEQDDGSFVAVHYSKDALQLPDLKRKYYAVDLYLEHPFADKWYGRIDYTWSRSYGNTEGQLASDLDTGNGGQADVSVTQDWDLPQLMVGANGKLPNNRTHQIKAFGYFQATDDLRFGANLNIASGRPKNCTSFYPTADAGLYNGAFYYWCGLPGTAGYERSPRGSHGNTPWTYIVNLNAAYTPSWLDKNLTLQVDVLNAFNKQTPTSYNPRYASSRSTVSPLYDRELNFTDPRTVRFTARYDF
ncbi:TonB-dependent receptor [Luteibacter sp. 22Crub2.1]|uniref:TonB-dependent receptor n=1 Tax=Luteibacter sp. 22Crub2.1 TaxID=1283288 RepID=UPI0009A7ACFA|nr:TonB-dependent receptor [Luteibacter sp. 22Crub2.1]SKB99754.1 Outer membrane receptor for ferrienterochelin and colicins [Luteibacter sp. 22Crub2.1]